MNKEAKILSISLFLALSAAFTTGFRPTQEYALGGKSSAQLVQVETETECYAAHKADGRGIGLSKAPARAPIGGREGRGRGFQGEYGQGDTLTLPQETTVAVYDVLEISLTSERSYSNPYKGDIDVTAVFTGPEEITQTAHGFWDGGDTFRVRFAPTVEGAWMYLTRSVPEDAGLCTSGSFLSTPAREGSHGFVRRDADNPYSLVFDDGTRYFMFGQTYYEIILNALAGDKWKEAVDNSSAHGINKIRLLVYTWSSSPETQFYPDAEPFLGGDHDVLNLTYWQKLDEIIRYLNSQDIVADLVLLADSTRIFGTPAQDERYVRYIFSRYAAYPNVIWCLSNEWNYTGKDKSYWDAMGGIVRDGDPWMTREGEFLRPLSVHQQTRSDFQYFGSTWPVHAIIQYGVRNRRLSDGDAWGSYGILQNLGHNMPVVNDEYGYIGELDSTEPEAGSRLSQEKHRNVIWGIVTAGGYASAGDARIFNDGPGGEPGVVYRTSNWHDAEEYDDIKRLVDFWTTRGIQYWKMTSQNSLVTAGGRVYVLGSPNQGYVVYAAAGGTFGLDLPTGLYQVLQYNPCDGAEVPLPTVSGGGPRQFTMPDDNDWVLDLRLMQPVRDLRVSHVTTGTNVLTATLHWSAPADAITYTLRYSDSFIAAANWDRTVAVTVPFIPSAPGTTEWLTVPVPYSGGTAYFALKYQAAWGHWSPISNNGFWPHFDSYVPFVLRACWGSGPDFPGLPAAYHAQALGSLVVDQCRVYRDGVGPFYLYRQRH